MNHRREAVHEPRDDPERDKRELIARVDRVEARIEALKARVKEIEEAERRARRA